MQPTSTETTETKTVLLRDRATRLNTPAQGKTNSADTERSETATEFPKPRTAAQRQLLRRPPPIHHAELEQCVKSNRRHSSETGEVFETYPGRADGRSGGLSDGITRSVAHRVGGRGGAEDDSSHSAAPPPSLSLSLALPVRGTNPAASTAWWQAARPRVSLIGERGRGENGTGNKPSSSWKRRAGESHVAFSSVLFQFQPPSLRDFAWLSSKYP